VLVALQHEGGYQPHTFTIVFSEDTYNEAGYARLTAVRYRAEHKEIRLSEKSLIDQLPAALSAMDQPTGDGVNTYIVSQAVHSAGVKVALSGLGADEIFGGYPSFTTLGRVARYLRLWNCIPVDLRLAASRSFQTLAGSSVPAAKLAAALASDGTLSSVFPIFRQVLSSDQRRALVTDRLLPSMENVEDSYIPILQDAFTGSRTGAMSQISYAEARTYMHDVLLRDTDQMSMAHGLEVRVPFLDHKLVEYVMGLPDEYKRSQGVQKRLLVESLGGLLPPEVVVRSKQGFTLPFDVWMRGAMRQFCEARLSPDRVHSRGILNPEQVQALWHRFLDNRPDVTWSRVWVLVVLEEWLERNQIECE